MSIMTREQLANLDEDPGFHDYYYVLDSHDELASALAASQAEMERLREERRNPKSWAAWRRRRADELSAALATVTAERDRLREQVNNLITNGDTL